jgi:hypothetical protein
MEIRMAGTGTANPQQHLPRPRLWHRHVPKLAWLLPFDELKGLDDAASYFPVASLA